MSNHTIDSSSSAGNGHDAYKLVLVGLTDETDRPTIVVQALDANNKPMHTEHVTQDGAFSFPKGLLTKAHRVVLGAPDDKGDIRADASISYSVTEFNEQLVHRSIALSEGAWSRFRFHWVCVSGNVRACRRPPWWFNAVVSAATSPISSALARTVVPTNATSLSDRITPSLDELIYFRPYRCEPVCLGRVDVYRRTCCCWPIVIDDRLIFELIKELEIHVKPEVPPKRRFPPPPPPPIGDPLKTEFFKDGALNEFAVNATRDLHALRTLPMDQAVQYVQSRPYLFHRFCNCSWPVKVAMGTIQSDGSFDACWVEATRHISPNCYDQYAYVVRQKIGPTTRTIYNGITAGAWFSADDVPVLTSYDSYAYTCEETGTDGSAHVFLDLIGHTESHELTTPPSSGWDRVAIPNGDSGLGLLSIGPINSPLRNLGGKIALTFFFSPAMASIGAYYYRISICRATDEGNPTGTRHYYGERAVDVLAWEKVTNAGIVPETLGPMPPTPAVSGEKCLYRIPYSDQPWVGAVRYHALIDTLQADLNVPAADDLNSPAVNHLVTLELFDSAGKRLCPNNAQDPQPGDTPRQFEYRRWSLPGNPAGGNVTVVPYAALTHLFCWDNREPVADITRLVMNGRLNGAECQFLEGPGDSTFAIEYRAYVPDQRFQRNHEIHWVRGLNGGSGTLPTPLSPANVGQLPSLPVISGTNTFELMLTNLNPPPAVLPKCSFAVTLTTWSKTTDGSDLSYPSKPEVAAFALEIPGA